MVISLPSIANSIINGVIIILIILGLISVYALIEDFAKNKNALKIALVALFFALFSYMNTIFNLVNKYSGLV